MRICTFGFELSGFLVLPLALGVKFCDQEIIFLSNLVSCPTAFRDQTI